MRDYIKLSSEEYNSLITEVSNLRRARDLWRTALESISAYIFITDLNGNIILQNRILESFNSNHIEDLIPSEINWKANGSYELELLGKWVTLLISDTRFKFPGKTIVISDISILKETQQELQNMQKKLLENSKQEINKLSLAVEQCPAEIVISNTNGIIEYVNPFFEEVTGYSFDDAIEHPTKILKSNYHNSNFYNKLWDTITSGNKWSGELLNRDKNGHLYWERASISPL